MASFTDHPSANEIVISHPADGPVPASVFSWHGKALSKVVPCHAGYAVRLGEDHPEPNHTFWAGNSHYEAFRRARNHAELAAMMISEGRLGWVSRAPKPDTEES